MDFKATMVVGYCPTCKRCFTTSYGTRKKLDNTAEQGRARVHEGGEFGCGLGEAPRKTDRASDASEGIFYTSQNTGADFVEKRRVVCSRQSLGKRNGGDGREGIPSLQTNLLNTGATKTERCVCLSIQQQSPSGEFFSRGSDVFMPLVSGTKNSEKTRAIC